QAAAAVPFSPAAPRTRPALPAAGRSPPEAKFSRSIRLEVSAVEAVNRAFGFDPARLIPFDSRRLLRKNGEPKFHELEPAERLVAPTGRPAPGRVDLIGGAPTVLSGSPRHSTRCA